MNPFKNRFSALIVVAVPLAIASLFYATVKSPKEAEAATFVPVPQWLLRFDGTFADTSGNSKTVVVSGSSTIATDGTRGQVLSLNGSANTYVRVTNNLSGSYSKSAWVYKNDSSAGNILSGGGGTNRDIFWVTTNTTSGSVPATFALKAGQAAPANRSHVYNPTVFPLNTWVHVAVTYDATTQTYRLYQDGTLVSASSTNQTAHADSSAQDVGAYSGTALWVGMIDDAEIWNTTLTDSQILAVYQGDTGVPLTPSAPATLSKRFGVNGKAGLAWSTSTSLYLVTDYVLEYKAGTDSTWIAVNDGVGTSTYADVSGLTNGTSYDFRVSAVNMYGTSSPSTVLSFAPESVAVPPAPRWFLDFEGDYNDRTSNGRNGTATGTVSIIQDPARGRVVNLNGGWVTVTNSLSGSYTKTAWVSKNTSSQGNIISSGVTAQSQGDVFWITSNTNGPVPSTISLKVGHNAPLTNYAYVPTAFPLSTWVHVAVTFDNQAKTFKLYQNGVLLGTSTSPSALEAMSPSQSVGSLGGATSLVGMIDDAGVWNVPLSDAQILAVYAGESGAGLNSPGIPTGLVAYPSNGSALLQWTSPAANGSPITDYVIEYKQGSSPSWLPYADGTSTATSTTVSGLTNGTSYDFRVSAVNAVGTSLASSIATTTPRNIVYFQVLSSGQSLSVGSTATPRLTSTQPYENVMLSPNAQGTSSPLIPLIESSAETPSSGLANTLRANGSADNPIVVGLHGVPGYTYSQLKKGTAPYAKGMEQASTTKAFVESIGAAYRPVAVTIVHGENDYLAGNAASYAGYLQEWQHDYETDMNALTGFTSTLPMFISQMNGGVTGTLAVAQLAAHKANPGKIILTGPKYHYGYNTDHVHLTNEQSKHSGEMLGKVISKVVNGETWNPLMPTAVVRNGNVITIDYHIPVGTLALDTTTVAQRANYGFEFVQSSSTATTSISSVELVNGNTQVRITLDGVPDGSNQRVRYAWNCPKGGSGYSCGDASDNTYVGGNIRDTDSAPSPAIGSTGLPLYDWSVTFDEPVSLYVAPVSSGSSGATHAPGSVTAVSSAPVSSAEIARIFGLPAPAANAAPDPGCAGGNAFSTMTGKACSAAGTAGTPAPALPSGAFTANLSLGMTGPDVLRLQRYLNARAFAVSAAGAGSPGKETSYFGPATRAALARFQKASGIAPAAGYFGPATRALVNR